MITLFTPIEQLDKNAITHAVGLYFPNGRPISQSRVLQRAARFYANLPAITTRSAVWNRKDIALLEQSLVKASLLLGKRPTTSRPLRMLVTGCGDGRTADIEIRVAQKYGFSEIVFNDLNRVMLDAARERVAEIVSAGDTDIDVRFVEGGITELRDRERYDLIEMFFFVSSEIYAIDSVPELRATRASLYQTARRLLRPGGVLIEDVPDRDVSGFYRSLCLRTGAAITLQKCLPGETQNFAISVLGPEEHQAHLRYMPTGPQHRWELRKAGLVLRSSWRIATNEVADIRRVRRADLWQAPIGEPVRNGFDAARPFKEQAMRGATLAAVCA